MLADLLSASMTSPKKPSGRGGWRPGAGRKRAFELSVDRTIRFEGRDLGALEGLTTARVVTTSDLVREAVAIYLRRSRRR